MQKEEAPNESSGREDVEQDTTSFFTSYPLFAMKEELKQVTKMVSSCFFDIFQEK
jgi:hypothetical protein